MNTEDIIKLAKEANMYVDGDVVFSHNHDCADVDIADLQKFASLVEEKVRDACAAMLEANAEQSIYAGAVMDSLLTNAADIRARRLV